MFCFVDGDFVTQFSHDPCVGLTPSVLRLWFTVTDIKCKVVSRSSKNSVFIIIECLYFVLCKCVYFVMCLTCCEILMFCYLLRSRFLTLNLLLDYVLLQV